MRSCARGLVHHMKSRAAIRIFSSELTPVQISEALGQAPSFSRVKYEIGGLADRGERRSSNRWRLDVPIEDVVPLEQKVWWVSRFVNDRLIRFEELIPSASRIDLYCSLFAQTLGETETLLPDTIHTLSGLPFGFELAFYHPKPYRTSDTEDCTWHSVKLLVSGVDSSQSDTVLNCCRNSEYNYSWVARDRLLVESSLMSGDESLTDKIAAMANVVELLEQSSPHLSCEIRCFFESSGGGLGGVSIPLPIVKRLERAHVTLQFRLGRFSPHEEAS